MDNDSSQYKAANSGIKNLSKHITGLNRLRKQEKLNQKLNDQKFILERLRYVSDEMHKAGASEQSTRLALQGTYELLKVTLHQKLEKSAEERIKNPDSPYKQSTQAPLTILSEVESQQVDWLWQRRIPLGKITILDGDPGMGKSLLSIFIAARVSTGQPMPDGAPGKQGKIILIAPEDCGRRYHQTPRRSSRRRSFSSTSTRQHGTTQY